MPWGYGYWEITGALGRLSDDSPSPLTDGKCSTGSVRRREGCGGNDNSITSRFGVASRVGGVDCSDIPEEPAVEGLVISPDSRVFLLAERFRVGTPSGQVHSLCPCVHRKQLGLVSSHLIFFPRQVMQPVLLRVYLGRFRCPFSTLAEGATTCRCPWECADGLVYA